MTDPQKEFLQLCIVEQKTYKEIAEKLNVPKATLTEWYEKLKAERIKIAGIRILWARKKIEIEFAQFYQWYLSYERKCNYCDVTEQEIESMIESGKLTTKRLPTRGSKLELDRKQPNLLYNDFDNLTYACYWCNNAKTDTFTEEEFKQVGQVFKSIWQARLSK